VTKKQNPDSILFDVLALYIVFNVLFNLRHIRWSLVTASRDASTSRLCGYKICNVTL